MGKEERSKNAGGLDKVNWIDPDFVPHNANAALIGHTKFEFVVQYLFLNGINNSGYDLGSFVMNPVAFKKMQLMFAEQVQRYEHTYGEIETGEPRIVVPGAGLEVPSV